MRRYLTLFLSVLIVVTIAAGCNKKSPSVSSEVGIGSSAISSDSDDVLSNITDNSSESSTVTSSSSGGKTSSSVISAPVIKENEDDKNAKLPTLNITNKNITVCIDWSPSSSWVKAWTKALEACYPGMKITWKQATPAQKVSKLAVWKQSNTSPDLIYIKPEESWPALINQGLVDPVDSYIDISKPFWGSARDTMNGLKIDGKNYVLVSGVSPYGSVIYQKDVFKNAGLEDPVSLLYKNQWTWSKLEEYAQKMTKINTADDSKSKYGLYISYGEVLFGTTGKDLIGYDTSKKSWVSNLNDAGIKQVISFITSLGPTGKNYCLTGDSEPESIRAKVKSGQVAMYMTAASMGIEFPNEAKAGELISVPVPRKTDSNTYYHAASIDGFCIPTGAKNPVGGTAFAIAVRAMEIMNLELGNDIEDYSTDYQDTITKYTKSVITAVPMQFRRLDEAVKYWSIWGPGFYSGDAYSGIVAKEEPTILEELKKQ